MNVNGVRFFMPIFKNIIFRASEYCKNGKVDTFIRCTRNTQRLAAQYGNIVIQFNMDGELESLRDKNSNVLIIIFSREDHMSEAERNICTIKYRTRITLASLHFQRIPNQMLVELVFGQVFWLNNTSNRNGYPQPLFPALSRQGKR